MGSIILVRHGQASFGAENYDELSERGHEQARQLGYAWEASGWRPDVAVSGSMQRHHQTAIASLDQLGDVDGYDVDAGWDEFDHEALVAAHRPGFRTDDPRAFQELFLETTRLWQAGELDGAETFVEFCSRVITAFGAVAERVGSGETAAVFTSGGPIAVVASHLLSGDASLWPTLNTVVINTGLTTIVTGRSGRTLLTYNAAGHLPADLVTYR